MAPQEYILGIDLGTTHSCCAVYHAETQRFETIALHGEATAPSVVRFAEGVSVGRLAALQATGSLVYDAKRVIGRRYAAWMAEAFRGADFRVLNRDERPMLLVDGAELFPEEVGGFLLGAFRAQAERQLGAPVAKAVITVPAHFNNEQRRATERAGRLAGLDVLLTINEPTAAALGYGCAAAPGAEQTLVVFDFGGGTFDVSVVRLHDAAVTVVASDGDDRLGGRDIDAALARLVLRKYRAELEGSAPGLAALPPDALAQVERACEQAKVQLSTADEADVDLTDVVPGYAGDDAVLVPVTRAEFEAVAAPIVDRCLAVLDRLLSPVGGGVPPERVDDVLLVGGSSRIPLVRRRLATHLRRPPNVSADPDTVVAFGAALRAAAFLGPQHVAVSITDVLSHTVGLEVPGGVMQTVVPRFAALPVVLTKTCATVVDRQNTAVFRLWEGELHDAVSENTLHGEFHFTNLPRRPKGALRFRLEVVVVAGGVIDVTAQMVQRDDLPEVDRRQVRFSLRPGAGGVSDEEFAQMQARHEHGIAV